MIRSAVAVVLGLALAACGPVQGSGKPAVVPQQIAGEFSAVTAEGALVVEIARGPAPTLAVEADDNLVPLFRSEVAGGRLRVWTDGAWTSSKAFVVRIGVPRISSVATTGAAKARVDAIDGDSVEAVATGASSIEVAQATGKTFRIVARGASSVTAAGAGFASLEIRTDGASKVAADVAADDAKISAEGACHVAGPKAKTANVVATGATKVDLDVSETLTADATGSASIRYGGKPKVGGSVGKVATVQPR